MQFPLLSSRSCPSQEQLEVKTISDSCGHGLKHGAAEPWNGWSCAVWSCASHSCALARFALVTFLGYAAMSVFNILERFGHSFSRIKASLIAQETLCLSLFYWGCPCSW